VAWTDSHCHVQYDGVGLDAVDRAAAAGVTRVVVIGTDVARSEETLAVVRDAAGRGRQVWATAGVHPHEATQGVGGLEALLAAPEVVGVGECGLDYYYEHSPRAAQLGVFAAQAALAASHDKALVVHTRDAWDDTFSVLDAAGVPERTVIHCFSGGAAEARACLDRGCYLSFSGIVTFKNAADVREAAALCPIDRLLVETDAPFLAPVPHRGQPNEPAWVAIVGTFLADLRGAPVADIEAATWRNTATVFGLPD
jgi:TatD DNase family protein